jgi:hypothetical protein
MYRMGRLAHDLGASYVCARDGGGTEFHHNWCHDNLAGGRGMGIYLDNFSTDYFVYRNVVSGLPDFNITLNKPCMRNIVVNNTMLGSAGCWGRWRTDWMYACAYVNNAVGGKLPRHPQARLARNATRVPRAKLNARNFRAFRGAQAGMAVPGLTGDRPGIGAYDGIDPDWRAGHDFRNPPSPVYRLADTPLRNVVRHGSFDWLRYRGKLGPWRATGAGSAKLVVGKPGGIVNSYMKRDTIISAGLELSGGAESGVEQPVEGLHADYEYELSAWVKLKGKVGVRMGVREGGTVVARAGAAGPTGWRLLTARFRARRGPKPLTVFVTRTGPGTAYVDHVALAGIVKGIEPVRPGFGSR